MRKLTTKLAAVVLLLTIMCTLSAFSVPGSNLKADVHIDCACQAGHVCGRYTGKRYGEWKYDNGYSAWTGITRYSRKVETVCAGCGKTLYTEVEYKYDRNSITMYYLNRA